MTKSPKKTGSGKAASSDSGDAAPAAESPTPRPTGAAAARPAIATAMSGDNPPPQYQAPPQGPGAPQRMRHDGSPSSETRLNAAMKVLRNPTALALPSRVYSGQSRNWSR